MIKTILIVVAVLIAGVLIYASMQPDSFRVQRSAVMNAAPDHIFAILNDFRRSPEWSPYEKKDPAMQRRLSGSEAGKGAVYEFEGNKEVGAGRIEILDTQAPQKLVMRLDMYKPFKGSNMVEYTLVPRGSGTEVTWALHGPMPFLSKVMCVFFDMDKMVGGDFENGLAALKTLVEKRPA